MINGHGDDIHNYPDIRINFSSNVYNGFSHEGLCSWLAQHTAGAISNYPAPVPLSLEQTIAKHLGLHPSQVIATNGATEAIYLIAQAFTSSRSYVVIPTFSEYADACRMHQHHITSIKKLDDITDEAQMVWICNPNNPTGTLIPHYSLQKCIAKHPDTIFVTDESYMPFVLDANRHAPVTAHSTSQHLTGTLTIHSMTKEFAVPGLRLGYITGEANLLNKIRRYRMPWAMNQLSQDACRYLLEHKADYRLPLTTLLYERQRLSAALCATGVISVAPSDTHILLCRLAHGTAAVLKEHLALRHGILIRDCSNFEGLDNRYFRIAVQTADENDLLTEAIKTEIKDI